MKRLITYFSTPNALSLVIGSTLDRLWSDIDPLKSRKFLSILALVMTTGVGNAWGQVASQTPTNGSSYVVAYYASSKYYALPTTTSNGGTLASVQVTVNASGQVTSADPPVWTLEEGSTSGQFYLKYTSGNNTYYLYKNGTSSSNKNFAVNTTNKNYWTFATSGTGYTATAVDRGSNKTKIGYESNAFCCSGTAVVLRLLPVAPSGPTLTTSSSMTTLTYSAGSPVAQSFTIGGSDLTNTVTVTAPTDYEVCKTENGTYTSSVSFTNSEVNAANKTVYIRLQSGLSAGNIASRNITVASSGATSRTIAVTGSVPYTITWSANGSTHATTYVAVGGTLVLPGSDPVPNDCGCAGKTFYGWYGAGSSYSNASVAPSIAAAGDAVSADKTYYAVFADADGDSQTSTLTASAQGWSDGANATTKTISTVTYTWAQNNGSNPPKYYNTGTAVRLYQQSNGTNGCQVTISSSNTITGVVFTYVSGYEFLTNAPSVGTLTAAGVWSGSATSIVFKNKNNAQVRIQSIVVTYGSTTYSNYDTNCCTPLGTINGSVSWSNDGTSLTVKNWGYTQGTGAAESNISKYTVYLYSDADSYAASIDNADCTVANRASTGVTFTGLNYARTYKVKITATPASGYCPVDDVWSSTTYKLTCATPTAATAGSFARDTQKMPISWTSGAGKVDICYSSNSSTPGATPGSGYTIVSNQTSSPVNLDVSGLAAGNYYCWVRSVCDASNKSAWTAITGNTFTIPAHTLTITKDGGGTSTITPASGSSVVEGRTASITASPATGYAFDHWAVSGTNATLSSTSTNPTTFTMGTANATVTGYFTCVPPVIGTDPADANYYVGDSPDALSVSATLASGTLTYLWKVSTNGGSTWSDAEGTNNLATYNGASLSTASAGTLKFKCIVGNSQGGCTVESEVATITVANASYFPNGKTIFIQAHSTSAWTGGGCVKAWFHTAGGSETAQSTYWLFDATGGDAGKKLFAAVVPASGDLPYLDIQRFAANCSDWWNKNGGCSFADASGSNTIRSTGKHDDSSDGDYIRWNVSGVTIDLHGDPSGDEWASSLASFSDQGAGVWTATYNNYAPADAGGESQDFKAKTNYNGWIGNTGNNDNATLDGMHVGSTYNITATLDVTDHSLEMSKTFVKGTVHFDLQGHGLAISDLTNVTAGSKISAPSAPSATGYTFGGWYKEPACTNAWNFGSDVVNETMTLYAKWTANVYTITKTFSNVANAGLPASFTYTGAATTALNSTFTVNTTNFFLPSSIAVTMGGTPLTVGTDYTYNNSTGAFTFSRIISGNIVITATATAKLKSIAITTQPTTRKYFAGESFSSTGAVVTATMGDGSTKAVTASATWTPPATPLAAGTGLTVTASYTENAINQTATTTIDVYSVTVNKVNEDDDAVSADGVTATWTVGTKALAASASGASKYVFKQWDVTGATAASTSSANTTLSSPTANVVVNAVFYKPRVVKWSVNGNDSYNTGSPTTTVAYNGTISTVPTNPSGLACASTFIAWTDAAHNNRTTAKDDDSYYESKLFTDAGDFPNITAETTTFYAVFAEGGGAAVNTVMWSEDWTGATSSSGSGTPSPSDARPSAQGDHSGKTVYGGATITYTDGTGTYVRTNENNAGGTAPELLIKANENWTISGIPTGGAATLTLEYRTNGTLTVSTSTDNVSIGTKSGSNPYTNTITVGSGVTSFNLSFTQTSNRRIDNVSVKVASVSLTNYVTECDANIVKVTYDANGGSTSCTNTTTDKTEDFTVCGTEPTRDYYTFAGWQCSADDEVYAANATISAAAIDADFTLTAQWTPVTYNITYNLYGGTNSGSNPATYNVTTATITLQDPTKGHDRFEGWYSTYSAGVYSDQVTSIPLGSHDDITLHAKWAERHHIEFFKEGVSVGEIWRADDENIEDAVAGQGTAPGDQTAPTTCSSKVFMGWTEDPIDDETDDEPADLMKPAAGTVDEDKEFHAVWAIEESETGTVTVFEDALNISGTDAVTSRSGWSTISYVEANSGDGVKLSSKKNPATMTVDLSSKSLASTLIITFQVKQYSDESGYIAFDCLDDGTTASFSPSSISSITDATWTNKTCTVTTVNAATQHITINGQANARVYMRNFKITQTGTVYNYSAYSTSCCATKVTLSENSPEHGTIVFGKTSVGTCGGDKEVSLTITPEAGYQLHSYDVATGGGKVATKSVSPAISLDNNSSAVQNITLTFASGASGAYDVTASFTEMTVTSWAWTMHDGGGAIPDPLNLYVGQSARLDVAYTPAGVDASKKTYTRNKDNAYINWVGAQQSGYTTISGKASTGENTTAVTFTHADGPSTTVNVKVLPLPLTHFVDLVHGKAFANVAATIEDNALSATKTTPTSDDWTTPNVNPCEENHLHLVGWIREDWPALVNYLNGTGAAPTTVAITGAGNDGEDHAYYIAAGASINVQIFDGVTFYAVWSKVE